MVRDQKRDELAEATHYGADFGAIERKYEIDYMYLTPIAFMVALPLTRLVIRSVS